MLLKTLSVNANMVIIDMSGYANGAYIVVVSYEGISKNFSRIVIKQ
jgi:hypothetical protein